MSDKTKYGHVIISLIVAAAVLAAGMIYTSFREIRLENEIVVSLITGPDIIITDPDTGEEHIMKVLPASVKPKTVKGSPKSHTAGLLSAKVRSHSSIPKITMEDAKLLFTSGQAVFIDTRSVKDFIAGHIKGAVSIPLSEMPVLLPKYRKDFKNRLLITYCDGSGCMLSEKAAYNLFDNGFERIAVLSVSLENWKKAGMPLSAGTPGH